jgi:hypothetical protein
MEYTMIDGGGMMRNPLPGVHSFWLPYVLAPAILSELIREAERVIQALLTMGKLDSEGLK